MNNKLICQAELKAAGDTGVIEGYGSVFGVIDSYDDIVAPGAFTSSLSEAKSTGRMPAMLWQHDPSQPIGVWTDMRQDDTGLFVRGQLAVDTQRGGEALSLIKLGALTGLSIGYQTKASSLDKATGIRTLTEVALWEVSPVTFPANTEARITGAKNEELTVRDIERALREVGLSRSKATWAAGLVIKAIRGEPDADQESQREADAAGVLEALKRARLALT